MVFFLFLYSFDNYIFDTMSTRKICRYYNMIIKKITSKQDGLKLEIAIMECENPKGIVQFSHGMAEHKERYFDFMQYLNEKQSMTASTPVLRRTSLWQVLLS